jgi:hypothetical protein
MEPKEIGQDAPKPPVGHLSDPSKEAPGSGKQQAFNYALIEIDGLLVRCEKDGLLLRCVSEQSKKL